MSKGSEPAAPRLRGVIAAIPIVTSCANKYFPEMIVVAVGPPPEASKETQLQRPWSLVSATTQLAEILNARAYPLLETVLPGTPLGADSLPPDTRSLGVANDRSNRRAAAKH